MGACLGSIWTRPRRTLQAVDICFFVDPVQGRCVSDGIAGARNDLSASLSVDIANRAPTGVDASDEIIDIWVDGRAGLNHEHVLLSVSTNRGATWSSPQNITQAGVSQRQKYSENCFVILGSEELATRCRIRSRAVIRQPCAEGRRRPGKWQKPSAINVSPRPAPRNISYRHSSKMPIPLIPDIWSR
jgi:hypothetical protein